MDVYSRCLGFFSIPNLFFFRADIPPPGMTPQKEKRWRDDRFLSFFFYERTTDRFCLVMRWPLLFTLCFFLGRPLFLFLSWDDRFCGPATKPFPMTIFLKNFKDKKNKKKKSPLNLRTAKPFPTEQYFISKNFKDKKNKNKSPFADRKTFPDRPTAFFFFGTILSRPNDRIFFFFLLWTTAFAGRNPFPMTIF